MHADIHLRLHALTAAELHRTTEAHHAAGTREPTIPLRVRLGRRMVEWGLRLAASTDHPVAFAA